MPRPQSRPEIPPSFKAKKAKILSLLGQSDEAYTDKSPKGTVDAQIRELIAEINAHDGLVTTSSCAGRVAVFVEGPKREHKPFQERDGNGKPPSVSNGLSEDSGTRTAETAAATRPANSDDGEATGRSTGTTTASPGGKGGGRWLYVSHDPIPMPISNPTTSEQLQANPISTQADHPETRVQNEGEYFTSLFKLSSPQSTEPQPTSPSNNGVPPQMKGLGSSLSPSPRLVHLSFSPLILHILCATLHHARVLLAAAINAGFRESGVQSLRVMDDPEHGVMVAVRTAGLAFETVIGVVSEGQETADCQETVHKLVDENYLAVCAGVVNERFRWNDERRERFRAELRKAAVSMSTAAATAAAPPATEDTPPATTSEGHWEDKDERRRRKREEGLKRQKEAEKKKQQQQQLLETGTSLPNGSEDRHISPPFEDLDDGLSTLGID
ncbi:hypothetical protein ABEF95_011744 [Exophiala dermatitidis]